MAVRTIVISGPFSDREIGDFVALLRRIDEANPTSLFRITIDDPDGTMDAGERMLREALPPLPERATNFARASYRDHSFPVRHCDHCGTEYQGPAVYCSLDCALRDA